MVKVILQSCAKKYINFVFRPKMAIFRRAEMREGGLRLPLAQSICTHYSKKLGTLLFEKNRVQKTKVVVIQKEKRQPGLLSF